MRLVIVGLDGLDPVLVERWGMHWFKQRIHGKHYVGIIKDLYTPILWSCILTGMNVEEHGYSLSELKERKSKKAFGNGLLYKLYLLRRKIPIKRLGLRKLLIKLGLINPYISPRMPEHLLKRTFLEELKAKGYSVIAIEVPGYNESKNEYYRARIDELAMASFHEKNRFVEEALEDTRERIAKAIEYVNRGYDLIFAYSPLPDIAFHMVIKPNPRTKVWLRKVHYSLYKTTEELLNLAKEKGYAVLIISDHGFDLRKYYHSDYGFWSLNIKPPSQWNVYSILDFKKNIIKIIETYEG